MASRSEATYECGGCGEVRPDTELARARVATPLGQTWIRSCPNKTCAPAATEKLRAQFRPGDKLRVLEVIKP